MKKIATTVVGSSLVDVFVDPNMSGGSFQLYPDENSLPQIIIGLDRGTFWQCMEVAMHEAMEMAMSCGGHRLERTGLATDSADNYHFIMNHPQFSDIVARTAYFSEVVRKPLKKAWKKNRKK